MWASALAPTLVLVGGKSEAFFHTGAKALVESLPHAQYRTLAGRDHSEVIGHVQPFGGPPSEDIQTRIFDNMGNTVDYVYEPDGTP
jgi:hypothetical protein